MAEANFNTEVVALPRSSDDEQAHAELSGELLVGIRVCGCGAPRASMYIPSDMDYGHPAVKAAMTLLSLMNGDEWDTVSLTF